MMISKEFRERAWDTLKRKYGKAFLVCLIVDLISFAGISMLNFSQNGAADDVVNPVNLFINVITGLLFLIAIVFPLNVGKKSYFLKNSYGEADFKELFSCLKNGYASNVWVMLLVAIKTFLWSILLIVPGIIKAYEYSAIPYILAVNPGITAKEAFAKSKKIMTGNKWRLFKLQISFIGWLILGCATLGVGMFFLDPYMEAATTEFYKEVRDNKLDA